MDQAKSTSERLAFIDWTRGLAAVIMLQGHTFDSFTRTDLRTKGPFVLSQFFGGLPPAVFLFLTGITFAFLMDSQSKKQPVARRRVVAALKRSRYLFLIAFLFRLQLYVFGYPTSPASELLRVDILNCMGMAMLILSPMAVFTTLERIRLCTIIGVTIAMLSPVVSLIDANKVPSLIRAYLFPSYQYFGFFPWGAFLGFGMAAGSVIRVLKREDLGKAMPWALALGLALVVLADQLSAMPYSIYAKSEFWLNSPALTMIKTGVVLGLLAFSYLWVQLGTGLRLSVLRQIGTTSLIVYWVHIELVYGRWFGVWKERLSVPEVVAYTTVLIGLMLILSLVQTRWKARINLAWSSLVAQPERVSGD